MWYLLTAKINKVMKLESKKLIYINNKILEATILPL
jgi:hypothetical protein